MGNQWLQVVNETFAQTVAFGCILVVVFSQHLLTFVILLRCRINKLFISPQIVPLSYCLHWIKFRGYRL